MRPLEADCDLFTIQSASGFKSAGGYESASGFESADDFVELLSEASYEATAQRRGNNCEDLKIKNVFPSITTRSYQDRFL